MAWMKMSGQTWIHAAAFLGTWMVMMMAMMLPSLVPVLWRQTRLGGMTAFVGAGYFLVWAGYGAVAYALGLGVTTVELRWPALASSVPAGTGVVVLLAGCIQLTGWKVRQLRRCWEALCGESVSVSARSAWRQGVRLGVRCCLCCSGYMILLLVTGMMHLGLMTLVAASIAVERVAPRPERVARAAGVVILLTGVVLIARALAV